MKTNLKEISFNKFLTYCKENKKGYTDLNYINDTVLKIIYDYCVKKNLRTETVRCRTHWDVDKDCISYISNFMDSEIPTKDNEIREMQEEHLMHEVWCKAEWAARCLTRDTFGADAVKADFGNKVCKQIKEVFA